MGFLEFAKVLGENYIQVQSLSLAGTNTVPEGCNLLVIAGPKDPIPQTELEKIDQYLTEGGRLFVLFDVYSVGRETGLEKVLAKWGVNAVNPVVKDPVFTSDGRDVIVISFANHPAVNPLTGSQLQLILPRAISRAVLSGPDGDGLVVREIAFSGDRSFVQDGAAVARPGSQPLMAAVERTSAMGVRGSTRILVTGDSLFLLNRRIASGANRRFAGLAVNWLLNRDVMLQGIEPQPITEYQLVMSRTQMHAVRWFLLAAMPGAVLMVGGLVWLGRRR